MINQVIKGIILKGKNKEKASIYGQMVVIMKEIGLIIGLMVMYIYKMIFIKGEYYWADGRIYKG